MEIEAVHAEVKARYGNPIHSPAMNRGLLI